MKRQLAFVLGGGGSRGALQVGAIRALLEAGIYPQMLVGTSAGAVNAAYLALRGVSLETVQGLADAWRNAAQLELIPSNFLWLTVRALFNRPPTDTTHRLKEFFLSQGVTPELRFADIKGVKLYLVATDLNMGGMVIFGRNPKDSVMDGLLASTALPPWMAPVEKAGSLFVDGGVVSALPIEPALSQGATEIIAMNLADFRDLPEDTRNFGPFIAKLLYTMENRQRELEMALARAYGVRLRHIHLQWKHTIQLWDFSHTEELIEHGYRLMQKEIEGWEKETPWSWLTAWVKRNAPSLKRRKIS